MNRLSLIVFTFLYLFACSGEQSHHGSKQMAPKQSSKGNQQSDGVASGNDVLLAYMGVERKYYLKDCIVKVDFDWDALEPHAQRYVDSQKMMDQIMKALDDIETKKYDFPWFTYGQNLWEGHHVLSYIDQCEDRAALTQQLIEDYWVSAIDDFPEFTIDTSVEPGFDGTMSSGFWLDDEM